MARFDVLTLEDATAWRDAVAAMPGADISASAGYCRVFQENGDGKALCLRFQDDLGTVVYPVFRRSFAELPFAPDRLRDCADLSTPYGYGGVYVDAQPSDHESLMRRFRRHLEAYAADTRLISEFIRFHPMLENHRQIEGLIDEVRHHNDNVVLDLELSLDSMLAGCRQSFRAGIRQTERRGFRMERVEPGDVMDSFVALYGDAMRRRRNTGYLNFRPDFFRALFSHLGAAAEMFVVRDGDDLLAAAVILKHGTTIDYFLAANLRRADLVYTNHFLLFEIARWAKAKGYKTFHLGGGAESILFFKSGFSKQRLAYHVGAHVFDREIYARLLAEGQRSGLVPRRVPKFFFPAYRAFRSAAADRALLDALGVAVSSE